MQFLCTYSGDDSIVHTRSGDMLLFTFNHMLWYRWYVSRQCSGRFFLHHDILALHVQWFYAWNNCLLFFSNFNVSVYINLVFMLAALIGHAVCEITVGCQTISDQLHQVSAHNWFCLEIQSFSVSGGGQTWWYLSVMKKTCFWFLLTTEACPTLPLRLRVYY